ncbi:uncharacterized protein LOC127243641 isoform X2 [Andrographis paniculata]|uniref:uncharacterized protein LOC127243641 isoform X2 n=1 Tax=Andrographis paniculata TaxID=175694 RepID=UPI0021E8C205|nr:uncharacterized protein LOC127243641 isoform X2 [Andrographis paniculata]
MFKPARWWSEKNRIKISFELKFHASQLTQIEGDGLVVSIVPSDTGKATAKSDTALVREGRCLWENPLRETVKFAHDPTSDKVHERIYHFVVGTTGSSKVGVVGEASIDLSNYVEATKASSVSLPLRHSKTNALLHVSIQRIHECSDRREVEEKEVTQYGSHGTIRSTSVEDNSNPNNLRSSSESDVTMSSSESSSELETPWEMQGKSNSNVHPEPVDYLHDEPKNDAPETMFDQHRSSWEWLGKSTPETFPGQQMEEESDMMIKKLQSEVTDLSRQAGMSELELQTLRKQIVKETKRSQDLSRELASLKEERDALKEELEAVLHRREGSKTRTSLSFDTVNSRAMVEELRQELNHINGLNVNLRIQLQKTQESNSELILAVQDLEEIIEQKNKEMSNLPKDVDEKLSRLSDDDEQRALEELVKERSEAKEVNLLEQQITDLQSEIEIYKRDKDEVEMQMEQLALDYEIVKQENHNLLSKIEQGQIQEKLKMQYECTNELETHIENLEDELQRQSKEHADALVAMRELEDRAKLLEEELEKQTQGFADDLENLMKSKAEQEQRAMRAEEVLKKWRAKNSETVESLQEEFRKLSLQMACTFEANEKLTTKAAAEANDLRSQNRRLEEMLEKISEEHQSVKDQYEAKLSKLSDQVALMTDQMDRIRLENEEMTVQLNDQKKHAEESQKPLFDDILALREEIEMHVAKNSILMEELGSKEDLLHELEKMRRSMKEMELDAEQGNVARVELENRIASTMKEAEEMCEEIKNKESLMKEKESIVETLQSELDSLGTRHTELECLLSKNEAEKEKLRKQVCQLTSDLKKIDDALKSTKKKTKDGNARGNLDVAKVPPKSNKLLPQRSKEVESLKERIKMLETQIKSKETALETLTNTFLKKEKDLHNKIVALQKASSNANPRSPFPTKSSLSSNEMVDIDALRNEIASLKEKNASMEGELKEMQGRYSEISLKFAEVEGERQQLVMELRNLRNSNKSP